MLRPRPTLQTWRTPVALLAVGMLVSGCASPAQTSPSAALSPIGPSHAAATPDPSPSSLEGAFALGRFPEAPATPLPDATAAALQAILDAAVEGGLPGITATVISADGGVWSGAAGTADGVHPVETGSQFAIASLTKTVIAAEVMRLAEAGALRLGDQLSEHLPPDFEFDTNGATIENLLAMESGIPDPFLENWEEDPLRAWTPQEVLATVPDRREEAGDHFVYEDANYMLLGLVIEETTGLSVADALRAGILSDPAFSSLVYQPAEKPAGPLALPFLGGGVVRPNILEIGGGYLPTTADASAGNGSGCMASDSGTLALWGYQLFGGTLLSEESLLAMTDIGTDGGDDNWGLGVRDQTNLADGFEVHAVGMAGWDDGGYSTELTILPSEGIAISVMTNKAGDPKILVIPIAQALALAL